MTSSLYIHIPFCAGICDYCDFFSVSAHEGRGIDLMDPFIDAVLYDIKDQFALFAVDHVPTVYIGGGTPSALGAARMQRLIAGIQTALKPMKEAPAEFTIEANPESADEDFLRVCVESGVSRISLGVQTFHEPSRRAVRREGKCQLEKRLALAAEYFPGAFSVDLITGLPFQTGAVVREDIEQILIHKPAHVSLYSLVLEPETPLGARVTRLGAAACSLPRDDEADELWIAGRDKLEESGFAQYEVSNFALPEKTCAHNIRYWRMENWLGAGPAASGTIIDEETGCGRRFTYPDTIEAYLAAPRPRVHYARAEALDRNTLLRESLLMGFRYREGPDPHSFMRRFNRGIADIIPKTIARWRERGFFAEKEPGSLKPSREGLLFLNSFLRDAFAELN